MLEVTSVVAAAAGMLLYWFEWTFPGIWYAWKLVFVFIVAVEGAVAAADIRDLRGDVDSSPLQVSSTAVLTTIFMLPSLWMNWHVAVATASA